jgi:hypothetical protein
MQWKTHSFAAFRSALRFCENATSATGWNRAFFGRKSVANKRPVSLAGRVVQA